MTRRATRTRLRRRRRLLLAANAAILSAGLIFPLVSVSPLHDLVPPITVHVQGKPSYLAPGVTFLGIVARFSLHATSGDLLDVQGKVLRAGNDPGRILLDGSEPAGNPTLQDGDRIWVSNGKDRTEQLARRTEPVPGGRPRNPEYSLGIAPGVQVITTGALSGKLVSSVFRPTGPAVVPHAVALTFDDGPWPGSTERILGILQRMHAKATFFVIGYLAQRYPTVVSQEVAAGMAIGNHTWDHPYQPPFRTLPEAKVRSEIASTKTELSSLGVETALFRPPGGTWDSTTLAICSQLDSRVVLWSVDPQDWTPGRTPKQITKIVLANVRAGSIIELHDGGGDRSATARALPAIIRGIRARGLQLTTVEP